MVQELVAAEELVEIFVDTPLQECMRRDPKGLYGRASAGQIKNFTGVDPPYEVPEHPQIVLRTRDTTADQAARAILDLLRERSIIR